MTDRSGDLTALLLRGFEISTAPGFGERHPEIIQELLAYRLTQPVPPAQYAAQVQVGLTHNAGERLSHAQNPTLILFGAQDNVVPPANAARLQEKLPHAHVVILADVGHLLPIEAPQATADAVLAFLQTPA